MSTVGIWLYFVALLLSWANSAIHVALPERPIYAGSPRVLEQAPPKSRALPLRAATLLFVTLALSFTLGYWMEWAGLALFVMMSIIRRFEIAQWEGDIVVRLGKYVPTAACMLGWLVTQLVLGGLGYEEAERYRLGWDAACGMLAGAYVLAGIAKVRQSGWVWTHPKYQALLLDERGFIGPQWVRKIRLAAARSKPVSGFIGISGFLIEFVAAAYVIPAARPVVLAGVVLLHIGFIVLLGYVEIEWIVVMTATTLLGSH